MGSKTTLKKYLLCSTGGKKTSYQFAKTWGLINNKTFFLYFCVSYRFKTRPCCLLIIIFVCMWQRWSKRAAMSTVAIIAFLKTCLNIHIFCTLTSIIPMFLKMLKAPWETNNYHATAVGHTVCCEACGLVTNWNMLLYSIITFFFTGCFQKKYANHNSQKLNHLAVFKALCTS